MTLISRFSPMLIAVALAGCASSGFVSVEKKFGHSDGGHSDGGHSESTERRNAGSAERSPKSGHHRVAKGDTLYGIAWQYGLNPMDLAASNDIRSPYTIFPGQQIDIRNVRSKTPVAIGDSPQAAKNTSAPAPSTTPDKKKSSPVVVSVPPPVSVPSVPVSTPSTTKTPPQPVVKKPVPAPVTKPSAPSGKAPGAGQWHWPASGKVVAGFSVSEPVNKGINIAGKRGEPILAAASGTVVYAGQGLRGYGNLVIVKHDDVHLSAYAHAQKILVKESQSIKAGQKIAEIGSTGTDSVKLHFEIRKNGKPVDPLYFLPKR